MFDIRQITEINFTISYNYINIGTKLLYHRRSIIYKNISDNLYHYNTSKTIRDIDDWSDFPLMKSILHIEKKMLSKIYEIKNIDMKKEGQIDGIYVNNYIQMYFLNSNSIRKQYLIKCFS